MNEIKIEKVPCSFCGSSENKIYDSENEWKIVKCTKCKFIYTNPQPTMETLPQFYEEEYFKDKRHFDSFYNKDGSKKTTINNYVNRIQDIENHSTKRGRLLEIGCARGEFLTEMKKRGWDALGVEISEDAGKIANDNGIETFVGVFADYEPPLKLDAICMYQTLEHVPDPKEIIVKAFNDLNPGGIFVVEVPNIECFEQKFSKTRKHLSYDLPRHLSHFSPNFLKAEFAKAGFSEVHIDMFPPKSLVKLINKVQQRKNNKGVVQNSSAQEEKETTKKYSLLRKPNTKKSQIIRAISKLFPGWRFTITGIK
ncbi:MAG: SAM-dependent methyltransferase [Salibacteraceae bacterium]|jgi:SAM-dependent methyltransferase